MEEELESESPEISLHFLIVSCSSTTMRITGTLKDRAVD